MDRVGRKIYVDRIRGNQAGNRIIEGLTQRTAPRQGKGGIRKGFITLSYKRKMKINDGKKYKFKTSFVFQEEEILQEDIIGINDIELPVAYCDVYREDEYGMKRLRTIEINLARLKQSIDFESEATYYGECEECRYMLNEYPSGAWGVGYVCAPCAKKLRGEYEL